MEKKKILVTGVAGFMGSNLADRLLAAGHRVVGIDNLEYGRKEQVAEGVEFHKADIRSKEIYPLFEGVDAVFHLAAKNCLPDCQADPVATMDINVTGTANVFEAARRAKVPRTLYAESSAVEEGDDRLKGFYAISKLADGKIAEGYRAEFGLDIVGLRYFNLYGPRQDYRRKSPPVMSKLIITFLKGEQSLDRELGAERPVVFEGDEDNKRDFIYVDDVNDFHMLCLTDGRVKNKLFRLGSGRSTSVKEVYDTIVKLMGVQPNPIAKPRPPGDPVVATLADWSEAGKLGWKPKTSLEDGLRAQIEWMREEFKKGNIR
ncbi:MAG: NAD-dependent epimerase/dehydratase family protein [Candidatus Liptonbacteria bacterium]|nr:NAD-dependent epimerase/dehydratase family protein [Candidatus Liptonbacteria bacterium]